MKLLVIGASGQVGKSIASLGALRGCQVYKTSRTQAGAGIYQLDLAQPGSIDNTFAAVSPEVVVLCSAMTYVDGCEKDPALAETVNAKGPELIAKHCLTLGAKLIYLSTEYVFDGVKGPYSETDPVNPISVYGRTKLAGETNVLALCPLALAIRTTVVYSYDINSKNFIMQLIDNSVTGREMRVPMDQYSNPTYAPELADYILRLSEAKKNGIYNIVGADRLNRYDFAKTACNVLGLDSSFLRPVATAELKQPAARPLYAGLKTDKLMHELGAVPGGIEFGLHKILTEYKEGEKGARIN